MFLFLGELGSFVGYCDRRNIATGMWMGSRERNKMVHDFPTTWLTAPGLTTRNKDATNGAPGIRCERSKDASRPD